MSWRRSQALSEIERLRSNADQQRERGSKGRLSIRRLRRVERRLYSSCRRISSRRSVAAWALTFDGALSLSGLRLSAVRDYTGTLPQCKAIARPPLAGGFVGFHRHRQIINISDTLNHVAARVPAVDAVSEIRLGGCHKRVSARKRARSFLHGFLVFNSASSRGLLCIHAERLVKCSAV